MHKLLFNALSAHRGDSTLLFPRVNLRSPKFRLYLKKTRIWCNIKHVVIIENQNRIIV